MTKYQVSVIDLTPQELEKNSTGPCPELLSSGILLKVSNSEIRLAG
jgi:hypothetical protein